MFSRGALLFGKNTRVRKVRILLFNQSGGFVGNHGEEREKKEPTILCHVDILTFLTQNIRTKQHFPFYK